TLGRTGRSEVALLYVTVSICCGLVAAWAGYTAGRALHYQQERLSSVADGDDHLALRPAIGELANRLAGPVERVRRGHVRAQLAGAPPGDELLEVPPMALGLSAHERAPEDTDDVAALEQREVQGDGGNVAGREPDDQEAPFPGGGTERRLAVGATHGVVDDVGPDTTGELSDARLQVLGGVVDRSRRA